MDEVSGRKREREKSPGKGYPILSPAEVYRFMPIGHVDDGVSTRGSIARIRCLFTPRRASVILSTERKNLYRSHSRVKEREREIEKPCHDTTACIGTTLTTPLWLHPITRSRTDMSNGRLSRSDTCLIFQRASAEIILQQHKLCLKK